MTSTNSLNNNRFLPMFKNVFKQYIAFFLVVQIFSSIFAFIIPRLNLKSIAEMAEYMEAGYQANFTESCAWSMTFFLFTAGSIWMFILAISLFREIYSKRASAFYFAMPVKRGTYFNVNMLYGIVTVFISYVLITALSIISVKTSKVCSPEFYTFEPIQLVKVMTVTFLSVIASYAIFMLFAVLSGRRWHYIALTLVAGDAVYGIVNSLISYVNNSIWGISIPYDHTWIVSPSAAFLESLDAEKILKFVIVLIIQFVLFYLIGYTVFQKRKAEIAEASLAGKIVPTIIFVICLLSVSFACLALVESSVYVKLGVTIAVTVVVSIIITAIFNKKAFTKKSVKCLIGTLAAVLIIVAAVEFLPNIKYKNYVPEASEVESVVFDENASPIEGDTLFAHFLNTMFFSFDDYDLFGSYYPTYNFSSEESKAKIEELHKKMIEQTTIDNHYSDDYYYHGAYSVKLTYNLKNGKTVERFYDVCTKDIYDEYIALMQTEEAVRQTEPFNFKDEDILFIEVLDYRSDPERLDYDETDYTKLDEYDTLFDNVIKDRANEPKDIFNSLTDNEAFMLYDPDNLYRDEGNINSESFWDDEDNWIYEDDYNYEKDYPDYRDISIVVYSYYGDVTDEIREKLSAMTPEEILAYENEYESSGNHYLIMDYYISLNTETDTNTIAYLESLGIIK